VNVVTLQAISGAGVPGVASMEILDNVIPYIGGEEDKLEKETRKILGALQNGAVRDAEITVSAQCTRVPVMDGHLEMASIGLARRVSPGEVREALDGFMGEPQELDLPTAPKKPIHVLGAQDHPQPRLHRELDKGMAVSVGRIRECPLLDVKLVLLSHNTIRGAAGGALLCAEMAVAQGRVPGIRLPSGVPGKVAVSSRELVS
jgi:aspartate-semialdehyde dehydrogenase